MSGLVAVDRCPLCGRPAAEAVPLLGPRGGSLSSAAVAAAIGAGRDTPAGAAGERPGVARR